MTFFGALAGVLAGVGIASVVGHAASRLFTRGLSRPERVAWSFATGLLLQTVLFAALVSIAPARARLLLLAADAVIVAGSFLVRRPPSARVPGGSPRKGRGVVVALLAIAGAASVLFLVFALSEPMWSTDYLGIWGLKAKTIAEAGHVPERLFSDPALYWAHREYPLLVPISLAMLASFAGGWHDQALALLFPLCEVATLAALFGFLARRVSPLAGAAAAALTALCFPLYRAVNVGTAEVPFAFALVLVSTAFLEEWGQALFSRRGLLRLAVASLFCVSIKQEGWLFVGLLAAALVVRRRWLPAFVLAIPAALHWFLLYLLRGPQTRRDFDFSFFQPAKWAELVPRFFHVLARMIGTEALAAWLPLAAILLCLLLTRRGVADPILPILPLQVLCYAVAFSVSSFDPMYAVDGAFARIATTLFPALALVLAARLPETGSDAVTERSRS
jgi:hypothetical protein